MGLSLTQVDIVPIDGQLSDASNILVGGQYSRKPNWARMATNVERILSVGHKHTMLAHPSLARDSINGQGGEIQNFDH